MTKTLSNLDNNSRNEMFRRLSCQYINPESELDFKNPFELLCAVVLSAQATDASVNLVTPYLFEKAPDPQRMAALGADEIGKIIKSVGLWKNKSQNLVKLSLMLTEKYGGNVLRKAIDYFCHLAVDPAFYSTLSDGDKEFMSSEFAQKLKWLKDCIKNRHDTV